jgi:hypothetical protein
VQVKINNSQTQTNPNLQQNQIKTNPQVNNLEAVVEEVIRKYIQNLQLNPQPQNNLSHQQSQLQNNEFVIKASMKASYIALRLEQLLTLKKRITISAIGFAVPIELDTVLLMRKDLDKQGKKLNIESIELFEKEVLTSGNKKIISGLRITLSI